MCYWLTSTLIYSDFPLKAHITATTLVVNWLYGTNREVTSHKQVKKEGNFSDTEILNTGTWLEY